MGTDSLMHANKLLGNSTSEQLDTRQILCLLRRNFYCYRRIIQTTEFQKRFSILHTQQTCKTSLLRYASEECRILPGGSHHTAIFFFNKFKMELLAMRENSLKCHTSHCKLFHSLIGQGCASFGASPFSMLPGEVPEWPNGLASKAGVLARGPWVQIPPSPPSNASYNPPALDRVIESLQANRRLSRPSPITGPSPSAPAPAAIRPSPACLVYSRLAAPPEFWPVQSNRSRRRPSCSIPLPPVRLL